MLHCDRLLFQIPDKHYFAAHLLLLYCWAPIAGSLVLCYHVLTPEVLALPSLFSSEKANHNMLGVNLWLCHCNNQCSHVAVLCIWQKKTFVLTFPSPMTELTFLEVFFPKAQIQAHSAGTVKLANDHWLSTYWPITGPTFPTRASLWDEEQRREDHDGVCVSVC